MEQYRTLVIKPLKKAKFSKVSAYTNSKTTFGTEMDIKTGLYKTGLTEKEENDFEQRLKLEKGSLNKRSNYWGDIIIKLNNDKDTIIPIITADDELKEKVIRNRSNILSSILDRTNPKADFFIYDPEQDAKLESITIDFEIEASERFTKLSISEKRDLLRTYGKRGVDTMSEELIKTELWKLIKKNYKEFIDKTNDPLLKSRIFIEKLLEKDIIKKTGNNHYLYGDEHLGVSMDDVISFLMDPKNQKLKLGLQNKLNKDSKE